MSTIVLDGITRTSRFPSAVVRLASSASGCGESVSSGAAQPAPDGHATSLFATSTGPVRSCTPYRADLAAYSRRASLGKTKDWATWDGAPPHLGRDFMGDGYWQCLAFGPRTLWPLANVVQSVPTMVCEWTMVAHLSIAPGSFSLKVSL